MSIAIDWLKQISPSYLNRDFFAIKPGLSRIRRILSYLDIRRDRPIYQVVGTNGKGSTTYIISGLLQNMGYNIGTFVSPHEISPTERILVNNNQIESDRLQEIVAIVNEAEMATGIVLSYFELLTVVALYWFKSNDVDIVVLEAGMGGRWDASSALGQSVLVVTSIGFDHTDYLGQTLSEIVIEKAAAASKDAKIVVAPQKSEVYKTLASCRRDNLQPKYISGKSIKIVESNLLGTKFLYRDITIKTSLVGEFQPINIITAAEAVKTIYEMTDDKLKETVRSLKIPSRLEVKKRGNLRIVFDGGHNPDAIKEVCRFFKNIDIKPTIIYSSMKDKDYRSNLKLLSGLSDSIFLMELPLERAEKAGNLLKISGEIFKHINIISIDDLSSVFSSKFSSCETVLVIGSFYLTGLIKYLLNRYFL